MSNLRTQIFRFQQAFDESFSEAWDRFKDLLEKCTNHGFSPLHQIDTFYNGLCHADQDSLNSATGGNLLSRNIQEAFTIIENKARVRMARSKLQASNASSKTNDEIMNMLAAINKKVDAMSIEKPTHQVNVVNHNCETCGAPHPYYECPAIGAYAHENVYVANTYPPQGDRNLLSYRSNNYLGPPGFQNHSHNNNVQNRTHQVNQNQNRTNHGFQNQNQGVNQNRNFKGIKIKPRIKGIFIRIKVIFREIFKMLIMRIIIMEIRIIIRVLIKTTEGKISIKIKMWFKIRRPRMRFLSK